jgi:protein TonB
MEAIDQLTAIAQCDRDDRSPKSRPRQIGIDAELRFLAPNTPDFFWVRLGRELREAARAITCDPAAFGAAINATGSSSHESRKRIHAGIIAAISFYAIALSGIYVSYRIFRNQVQPNVAPARRLNITYVAPPPMPVIKTVLLKEASGPSRKDLLTIPTQPSEQPKVELPEAKPTPPPPEPSKSETSTAPQAAHSPANETASRESASDDAARGLERNGVGAASGSGRGGSSNSGLNYNDVFSVSNVTTRPQILARPVPGYTEEARRAQVEGAVKLSVVLNADGTVSGITVARGLGYGLDQKAIEAARELRFVPAQKDGHPVSVRIFLEFKFTLL